MHHSPLIAPIVALVAWSLVMSIWMYAARLPAMRRAGISLKGRRGTRGGALEGVIPDEANWKAHNYAHLMEQPTIFYAIVIALILMGFDAAINVSSRVGLRGAADRAQPHPGDGDIVLYRFIVFTLSSLCLIGLTTHAAIFLIHRG